MIQKGLHNEIELFARIAQGEEAAFRELFHFYNHDLLPFILKLTGSKETAEEVIQDIFLSIWQHRDKLVNIDNPRAWIIRIASNTATNYIRKQAANGRLFEKLKHQQITVAGVENDLAAKEMAIMIQEAIAQLTAAERVVYKLSREEGMSIPQIAESLKVSPNTVKNQLVSALKTIRTYLRKRIHLLFFIFFPFF